MISLSRIIKSMYTNVDKNNIIIINGNSDTFIPQDLAENAYHYETASIEDGGLDEVRSELESLKLNAQMEASKIIENANIEAARILENANQSYNEQFESAKKNAAEAAILETEAKSRDIIEEAERIKLEAQQYKENFLKEIEPEIIDFTINAVEKLVEGEKILNKDLASIIVKSGLRQVPLADDITVHLSPEDFDKVDQLDIMKSLDHVANLNLVMDAMLKPFQCIIETSLGNVDCSIDVGVSTLKERLKFILNN